MQTPPIGVLIVLIIILIGVLMHSAMTAPPVYRPMPAFVREAFMDREGAAGTVGYDPLAGPSGPGPRKVNSGEPWTLLEKLRPTNQAVPHYGENALSCYAKDFWRGHERVGNYRQETNNYKQDYPDSCSSARGEFVLGFYQR